MINKLNKIKLSLNKSDMKNDEQLIIYKQLVDDVKKINLKNTDDGLLKEMSQNLKQRAKRGESLDELLLEAFALVNEAIERIMGMRPYDVQIMAGVAMHRGKLVEMQTGEGKTLAAVFTAYLNSLTGEGVHILTANDYLARRDAGWMGRIYTFLGLTVGYVNEGMNKAERRTAYEADITYVTAKEAGFDYLRDSLWLELKELTQRKFNMAIVDEADFILIDEARIPLVIAENIASTKKASKKINNIINELKAGVDYDLDEYSRNIYLTEAGVDRVEKMLGCGNIYSEENYDLLLELYSSLHANILLKRDVDYIVKDRKVELVDEFTGRIADRRSLPDGLQAAVEAKEGLSAFSECKILNSITMQHFIKMYPKLCGMTGTASTSSAELMNYYGLEVAV
ncbi:MAG: accessory Sec system translocase SecA2, partial [Bacillota bacterium]|nr:accessory Sec system translocase SecA2 [Bacillota bacterium]